MSEAGKVEVRDRVGEERCSLHSLSCDHPITKGQSARWVGFCVETGEKTEHCF